MDDGFVQIKDRETDIIARQLSQAIVRSDEYRDYREALAALKEQPDLYAQVNELRRQNFARQNGQRTCTLIRLQADFSTRKSVLDGSFRTSTEMLCPI